MDVVFTTYPLSYPHYTQVNMVDKWVNYRKPPKICFGKVAQRTKRKAKKVKKIK